MTAPRVRVLIVDDSAFVRKVLRELLSSARDIEVVGYARNGLEALEQIALLRPDVVTLDLMMPELDGLGVLRALRELAERPRVLLVSVSAADSDRAVEGLQLGALDVVHKPTALATDRLYEIGEELLLKVRLAAATSPATAPERRAPAPPPPPLPRGGIKVIVVGTSTGGPQALTRLFEALPGDLSVPLLSVVHIPEGFTASLAERLNKASALTVAEASEGLALGPGLAVVARAGLHLCIEVRGGVPRCHLDALPMAAHRPSVDVLFESAARVFGDGVLAVVLTGMGDDGLEGARAVRSAGGFVITEHPSTSVVDGMPRAVREAGLSNAEVALERMAEALVARL